MNSEGSLDTYTCRRGTLRRGDRFKVRGGPYYRLADGGRCYVHETGTLTFLRHVQSDDRQFIEALGRGGFCVLSVGPVYESRRVPGLVHRPYRIVSVIPNNPGDEVMAVKKKSAAPKAKATTAPKKKAAESSARSGKKGAAKMSCLDAAAKVLAESKKAMTTNEMIAAMEAKKYWRSPGGATPHATLYSAILRERKNKGKEARFKKTERGRFAANQ